MDRRQLHALRIALWWLRPVALREGPVGRVVVAHVAIPSRNSCGSRSKVPDGTPASLSPWAVNPRLTNGLAAGAAALALSTAGSRYSSMSRAAAEFLSSTSTRQAYVAPVYC